MSHFGRKAILALVLLRVCVGWHFFGEGTKKLKYNPDTRAWSLDFSAEGFFSQAKGPLAGFYHSQVPGGHQWQSLLRVPKQAIPLTSEQKFQQSDEIDRYNQRRKQAQSEKKPLPIEFPTFAPYHDWANQIVEDWRVTLKKFTDIPGLSKEQQKLAADQFELRHQQLADYLAEEAESMVDYQHNLWRLEQKQTRRGIEEIPYLEQRLLEQQTETIRSPLPWIAAVQGFESAFQDHLLALVASQKDDDLVDLTKAKSVLTDPKEKRMTWLSMTVACVVTGVGICLLLGFLTPLASCLGALFLLTVISTQPPWIAGAAPTISQTIELTALLVLAATSAGRWAGLDYFWYTFYNRFRST